MLHPEGPEARDEEIARLRERVAHLEARLEGVSGRSPRVEVAGVPPGKLQSMVE